MNVFSSPLDLLRGDIPSILYFAETQAVSDHFIKEYRICQLLNEENVLTTLATRRVTIGKSLREAALRDLNEILAPDPAIDRFFADYQPSSKNTIPFDEYQSSLLSIVKACNTPDTLDRLIDHYQRFGSGQLARYIAYRFKSGSLIGIESPDKIPLSSLFCLDRQKKELCDNTLAFLNGKPANNVLLYGNSGCGKSSLVKAQLNEYYPLGLRMVQIDKEELDSLPVLLDQLRRRPFFYVVFLDDLSFENDDTRYKALKTVLEGTIEAQPSNVLFYATSNRFHIVNESWEDRNGGSDVHQKDTQNEKLSLSERFGIRISFLSPDQKNYLSIVEGILNENGCAMTEEIRSEALRWAIQYHGRSGRTASQFARYLLSLSDR